MTMPILHKFGRGGGIDGIMLIVLLAFVIVLVLMGTWLISGLFISPKPHAFRDDVLTIVGDCANANTFSSGTIVGSQVINSHSVNADEMVRCLYAAGITLYQHGDPVQMKGGAS
jgi:hypothetical protein